jgi:hypothetical protein
MAGRRPYLIAAAAIFAVEVLIAIFASGFIRHVVGDFLIAILLYCLIMGASSLSRVKAAIATLLFSFFAEAAQAFGLATALNLEATAIGRLVFGSTFDWADIAAYAAGVAVAVDVDGIFNQSSRRQIS